MHAGRAENVGTVAGHVPITLDCFGNLWRCHETGAALGRIHQYLSSPPTVACRGPLALLLGWSLAGRDPALDIWRALQPYGNERQHGTGELLHYVARSPVSHAGSF